MIVGLGLQDVASLEDSDDVNSYHRVIFGIAGLTCLVQLLLFLTIFRDESAIYLISKNKKEEALVALKKIYG